MKPASETRKTKDQRRNHMRLERLLSWTVGMAAFAVCLLAGGSAPAAEASGAFARQTGMSCFACHTRPPSMTAIGKRFFLQGYRTPHVRETIEHGEPGSDGGRM